MRPVYLDHNATAPLRPEARAAMLSAMDLVGNPSSVHHAGRQAKGLIERARAQVAEAFGAGDADIVFTSGATEAAALGLAERRLKSSVVEHDCVAAWTDPCLAVDASGHVLVQDPAASVLQAANSETGIIQSLPQGLALSDTVQVFGKVPFAFSWSGARMALASAHKMGGPKGSGALIAQQGVEIAARIKGGGQELGRRSGTENVIGIAGFGAAAQAAMRDLNDGLWEGVGNIRNILEEAIEASTKETILVGKETSRLPNTLCVIAPGWKAETQVMAMDLAGFAISAGSACSSGKVRSSPVLRAMGFDDNEAACAIRVSLGPTNTEDDVLRFAEVWCKAYQKFRARAA